MIETVHNLIYKVQIKLKLFKIIMSKKMLKIYKVRKIMNKIIFNCQRVKQKNMIYKKQNLVILKKLTK